jgi:rhodanese-related sulfurtransferase
MAETLTLVALAADPERYHLIDVRDATDYAVAHVKGAVSIPLSDLADRAGEIPDDRIPVIVCNWGASRSDAGAATLRQLGHDGTLVLEGGTQGWLTATAEILPDP